MKSIREIIKTSAAIIKTVFGHVVVGALFFVYGADLTSGSPRGFSQGSGMATLQRYTQPTSKRPLAQPALSAGGVSCTNLIVDGSFENGGIPNSFWDPETDTIFSTPVCDIASCGTSNGAGPSHGSFWVFFGAVGPAQHATIGQTVTIESGATATLTFQLRIGMVAAPLTDVMNVKIDGTTHTVFTEPAAAEPAYSLRTIDLSAFADGKAHQILFEYVHPMGDGATFNLDDVSLNVCTAPGPQLASVSGRIVTPDGRGVRGAAVAIIDSSGVTRTVMTSSLGFYGFEGVETGRTYTVRVSSKRYRFDSRSITVEGNLTDIDFMGLE